MADQFPSPQTASPPEEPGSLPPEEDTRLPTPPPEEEEEGYPTTQPVPARPIPALAPRVANSFLIGTDTYNPVTLCNIQDLVTPREGSLHLSITSAGYYTYLHYVAAPPMPENNLATRVVTFLIRGYFGQPVPMQGPVFIRGPNNTDLTSEEWHALEKLLVWFTENPLGRAPILTAKTLMELHIPMP